MHCRRYPELPVHFRHCCVRPKWAGAKSACPGPPAERAGQARFLCAGAVLVAVVLRGRARTRARTRIEPGARPAMRRPAKRHLLHLRRKLANRRHTFLHQRTADLAARFGMIAVEDLSVANMTASAKGTVDAPAVMSGRSPGSTGRCSTRRPAHSPRCCATRLKELVAHSQWSIRGGPRSSARHAVPRSQRTSRRACTVVHIAI
jgi:hypothetical protein